VDVTSAAGAPHALAAIMEWERQVNRTRVEQRPPEPDESRSYNLDTTVTRDEQPPLPGPPQETGTMRPHD
jgi:hypothetical protein